MRCRITSTTSVTVPTEDGPAPDSRTLSVRSAHRHWWNEETVRINKSIPEWLRAALRDVQSPMKGRMKGLTAPFTCVEHCPQPMLPWKEPYVRCDAHRGTICSHHGGTGRAGNYPDGGHLIPTKRCTDCNRGSKRWTRWGARYKSAQDFCEAHGLQARFTTLTTRSKNVSSAVGRLAAKALLTEWDSASRWVDEQRIGWCPFDDAGYMGRLAIAEVKHRLDGTCHPHIHMISFWARRPSYKAIHHCLVPAHGESVIQNIDWRYKKFHGKQMEFNDSTKKYLGKYMAKDQANLGNSLNVARFSSMVTRF